MQPIGNVPARASRRGILAKAATLGAAALAARAATDRPADAANGDTMRVGRGHVGTVITELGGNFSGPIFHVYNNRTGRGVTALMVTHGLAEFPTDAAPPGGAAIFGKHGGVNGHGVYGEASARFSTGVTGRATEIGSTGVSATSELGDALSARAKGDRTGVVVEAGRLGVNSRVTNEFSWGVYSVSTGATGIGVYGEAKGSSGTGLSGLGGGTGVEGVGASRGVTGRGTTLGVVAQGGSVGVSASASGADGIGAQASAKLVGLLSQVPVGDRNGIGVWGNIGESVKAADAATAQAGVVGTSTKVGVAGVGGVVSGVPADLSAVKGLTNRIGVFGIGQGLDARGVVGATAEATGTGVLAVNPSGAALEVNGVNRFSQAFRGSFTAGQQVAVVAGVKLTPNSGVVATLNSIPGPETFLIVAAINRAGGKVRLSLNKPAKRATEFTFFVVDTPAR